ncbi:MAG: LapA family protein [Alcaligenaceae bacterium]|nr:LapA family protein [Alcaligenaceae bacterium]
MKIRTVIFLVGFVLIASFAAINMTEILRPTTINLGLSQTEAPLGLILVGLLVVAVCFFLLVILLIQTNHLFAMRQVNNDAKQQRDLADSAEQSRFTELRQLLLAQEREQQQREETKHQSQLARLAELEDKLSTKLEESHNGLAASIGELEDRIERQVKNVN